ncbi:MAG: hypothetical protein WBW31_25205 [Candidatus Sulfotelmatobacter sp.]
MTREEGLLLTATAEHVAELFDNRDDMLIGLAAAILDLYRALFEAGADTKQAALARLRTQQEQLMRVLPEGRGSKSLKWIADSLENEKLDAAGLFRARAVGSA